MEQNMEQNQNQATTVYDQLAERGIFLPRPNPDRLNEELQSCRFTRDEMLDLGQRIAKATGEKTRLESDKSQVVKQFAAQIAARDAEIGDLSQKLSSGYEWKKVECATFFDYPRKGMATTYRLDTGEEINSRRMTYDELQLTINLQPEEPEEPEEPKYSGPVPKAVAAKAKTVYSAMLEEDPVRRFEVRKSGAVAKLEIYNDESGGFVYDAQVGPDTGDDATLELIDGGTEEGKPVETTTIAACAEIEYLARQKAAETAGKAKSAWAFILSWAVDTANEARAALRTGDDGGAAA